AVLDELRGDSPGKIDRDREAVPREEARRARDRGVDPDDVALEVDERPARVAGVDRRVGLDEVLERRGPDLSVHRRAEDPDRAADGADDAGGDAELEAERAAQREDPVAEGERLRVAQRRDGEVVRLDPQDGDVGARIPRDDLRLELTTV